MSQNSLKINRHDRLFPYVFSSCILYGSLAQGLLAADGQPMTSLKDTISLESKNTSRLYHFRFAEVMRSIIETKTINDFSFRVSNVTPFDGKILESSEMKLALGSAFSGSFVSYYEDYKAHIQKKFHDWYVKNRSGQFVYQWPTAWVFARWIRNAFAHGGVLRIEKANTPDVTWHGVHYTHQSKNQPLFNDIALGDLLELMLEMDAELDALGAPSLTANIDP